jgi:ethanolamine permease
MTSVVPGSPRPDETQAAADAQVAKSHLALKKVLGPAHIWGLGVGIVLVGEYMGWNFSVQKGGMFGALIAAWVVGVLYTCVAMIDSEVTSTVAAAGGQYTQAKHMIGPLMAFNVGLFLVLEYTMLEAADANVMSYLVSTISTHLGYTGSVNQYAFIILAIMVLAFLNYRGVLATLSINMVITAIAAIAIVVLFVSMQGWNPDAQLHFHGLVSSHANALPYGWLGVLAAFQFGMWYYLGIEGTCQAAEECRSAARSIPLGTMTGIITLLIAAVLTWYVCAGTLPWQYLGVSITPLFDAALVNAGGAVAALLAVGTVFATLASANGCINDASRAWFSMGRDNYLPAWFGAIHPRYRTPFRAILFLVPVAIAFAILPVLLDKPELLATVITFSILSALLMYAFMVPNMFRFRKLWPVGVLHRGYTHPLHPLPAITLAVIAALVLFATFLGYGTTLMTLVIFYLLASIWFVVFRYRYVRRGQQFTMPWPRPKGY